MWKIVESTEYIIVDIIANIKREQLILQKKYKSLLYVKKKKTLYKYE